MALTFTAMHAPVTTATAAANARSAHARIGMRLSRNSMNASADAMSRKMLTSDSTTCGDPGELGDAAEDGEDAEQADRQRQVQAGVPAVTNPVRDGQGAEDEQRRRDGPLQGRECLAHSREYDNEARA